jgi:general secretion pathway protein J
MMLRRGFTLVEVVISLGILLLIGTLSWSTIAGTLKLRMALEERDEISRQARVSIDRLKREIRLAFLTQNTTAINTYQTLFIGEDNGDEDTLWFTSMSHKRKVFGTKEADQAEITLWIERGPRELGQVLMHREMGRIDNEPDKDGAIQAMVAYVEKFNLRYLDPERNEWVDEWDTTDIETLNRLPRAVEITLIVETDDPSEKGERFRHEHISTVIIETASRITRSATAGDGSSGGGQLGAMQGMMR